MELFLVIFSNFCLLSSIYGNSFHLLDICDDGLIDSAVRINDGRTFLFKGKAFWLINHNLTKIISKMNGELISEYWDHKLPDFIDLAFTVHGDPAKFNRFNGKTMFVQVN